MSRIIILMSYNLALGFLPRTDPLTLGASSSVTVSFGEASGMMMKGPSAAAVGPHTLLVDPTMLILDAPFISPGITVVVLSGVADTYVIKVYGDSPRIRVFSEYEVQEEQGVPGPAESVFEEIEDPEDAHLEYFCRVADITLDSLFTLNWTPLTP